MTDVLLWLIPLGFIALAAAMATKLILDWRRGRVRPKSVIGGIVMSSCECCWAEAHSGTSYTETLEHHVKIKCICTQHTPEGARARAGRWWDEERQRDSREVAPETK